MNNNHIIKDHLMKANNIASLYGDQIEKGGVGSGRKIGKTKSGKDIYDRVSHSAHKDFSAQDHLDAAKIHSNNFKEANRGEANGWGGSAKGMSHYNKQIAHEDKAAELKKK
jgi:hypothetical protein